MSTAAAPASQAPPVDALTPLFEARHRFTVAEYHRMAEAGVFGPEPRVELLEGVIVEKTTKNPPHNLASDLIDDYLRRLVPAGYFLSVATSVTINERDSEPEPDAMILRGRLRDY